MRTWSLALMASAALLAGCGGGSSTGSTGGGGDATSNRLVDLEAEPPYVNALELDPRTKDFLLATNRGFWRVTPDGEDVEPVRGEVRAGSRRSPVGTFLELEIDDQGRWLGSGHPDDADAGLPQYLGVMQSEDQGRTWQVLSRLGDADLHKILRKHGRVYAFDAVLSAMLISDDDGRTFAERFTPRGLVIDFEVDPQDPERLVASTEQELFRSEDGGKRWRALAAGEGIRLAWPAPDKLYRATKDGTVEVSGDGGSSFERVGEVDGEPYKFRAVGPDELHLATGDARILHTTDGAKTWETVFTPPAR